LKYKTWNTEFYSLVYFTETEYHKIMTKKEFKLLVKLIISMLKNGKVDEVIKFLEELINEKN